jgi:UDP-glucose 4-epimerase
MSPLAGNRILITGGAGLIGSHIADQLAALEVAEIVVLDDFTRGTLANLATARANGNLTLVTGDIRDRATVAEVMSGIDVVFHEAAIRITQCAEDPRLAVDVLVNGAFNVFEAAIDAGVRRVVAASSASVYGQADLLPTPETQHPYHNDTVYGSAKAFNEGLLRSFHKTRGLDYVALRYFNVYGPRMDIYGVYTEVLVRWMERIAEGQAPIIHGDGNQTMDFIHVADIARANILAAQSDVTDEVYNVATGVSTSLRGLAFALLEVMGADLEPEFAPARALVNVQERQADVRKAAAGLGFTSSVSLMDGLADLVAWWRAARTDSAVDPSAVTPDDGVLVR